MLNPKQKRNKNEKNTEKEKENIVYNSDTTCK